MSRRASSTSERLEPPRKSVELEDSGAHELSSEEEYFSDASEGRKNPSRPVTPSSPIPTTRVEKVDSSPRHGEVPGTDAYQKRRQDAVPDEIEVVAEGSRSRRSSTQFLEPPLTPGGTPIPRTVVEKIDPSSPSHGDIPGTEAYKKRMADAPPDIILSNPDPSTGSRYRQDTKRPRSTSGNSIPETIITRADEDLAYGEVPGTAAEDRRNRDASPERTEVQEDPGTFSDQGDDDTNENYGDDFDDFEEGAQAGIDDDFGDFDDFEEGTENDEPGPSSILSNPVSQSTFPLLDFEALSSLPDLLESTNLHLDVMFPSTTLESSNQPRPENIPPDSPIFPTERSRSLWKQLITPPPLQPPNWTQSRIRRLFLISLGVPVDLDEILPPSKQKKLILPDITLPSKSTDGRPSTDKAELDSISKLKTSKANDSSASLDSQQSASKSTRGRTRPANASAKQSPPPSLDLSAVKRICATTDEKLEGFTEDELKAHVKELEALTEKTSHVLEYWLKRRDGLRKEKEAFEGVIENLVRHAKRVRTIK